MMANQITIVIPVFNRAETVKRTLKSIECQSARPLSVVLVDNNSTDSSLDTLRQWARRVQADDFDVEVVTCSTPGAAAARNAGLAKVRTPFTMFFDSDDEMLPAHLEEFEAAVASNPSADILGRAVTYNRLDRSTATLRFDDRNPLFNHIFHAILSSQRFISRTSLLREAGGWNQQLSTWDDLELGLRLLLKRPQVKMIPGKPTVIVHATVESLTGERFIDRADPCEKSLTCCRRLLTDAGLKREARWIDTRRVILAARYRLEGFPQQASALLDKTLRESDAPMRLRLLYIQHLLMKRGTAIPARLIL